eukprot:scpid108406/ scgid33089/ 
MEYPICKLHGAGTNQRQTQRVKHVAQEQQACKTNWFNTSKQTTREYRGVHLSFRFLPPQTSTATVWPNREPDHGTTKAQGLAMQYDCQASKFKRLNLLSTSHASITICSCTSHYWLHGTTWTLLRSNVAW